MADRTWIPTFLHVLRETGIVSVACRIAGTSSVHVARTRRDSPTFTQEMDDALADSRDLLLELLRDLAWQGNLEALKLLLACYRHILGDGQGNVSA
jgi:hypothetical protein